MWSQEKDKIVLGPHDYLSHRAGKDMRKQLIAAFDRWLHIPPESIGIITKVITMLHNASLLLVAFP